LSIARAHWTSLLLPLLFQGALPTALTFLQTPDGCLHAVFGPSTGSAASSFTVYHRPVLPQPGMEVRAAGAGTGMEPLSVLAKRLCVNP